jgi:hypothetical protein
VRRNGTLSTTPVVNDSATPVPFAFTFTPQGRLTEGEAGASSLTTYAIGGDRTLSDPRSASDGQMALCWIVRAGDFYYVANPASDNGARSRSHRTARRPCSPPWRRRRTRGRST